LTPIAARQRLGGAAQMLPSRIAHPATRYHLTSYKVEAAGIEPSPDFVASDSVVCNCENCQQCRAAYALHLGCFKGHLLASFDVDLQRLISAWDLLPKPVRKAIHALLG
jgi:hypothetical protein